MANQKSTIEINVKSLGIPEVKAMTAFIGAVKKADNNSASIEDFGHKVKDALKKLKKVCNPS